MKYYTRDLLTLLISLFILSSCKNPSGIGLDQNPGDSFYGTLNDTLTLHTVTARDDSARSINQILSSNANIPSIQITQLPFGYLKDDVLGETQANVALAIDRPSSGDIRLPENAQIDSAILVVKYGNSFVGDTLSSRFFVEVKQLDETYNSNTVYYSSKNWNVKNEQIGSAQIGRFNLRDSITITMRGSDGKDSVAKVGPQLRIRLNNSFVGSLLAHSLDSSTVNTSAGFREHIKGFYLTTNKSSQQGIGGISTLAMANSDGSTPNGLLVTYRVTDSEGKTDTLTKSFPIPVSSSQSSAATSFISSSVNRTFSAAVQSQLANQTANQTTVYAQSMGGLRTRVAFPYLDQLKAKKIAINKAELVVYVDEENLGAINTPAPRLTLYRRDVAGRNQPIPDGDSRPYADIRSQYPISGVGPLALGGYYDDKNKRYVFNMTSFVQDVILGKVQNSEVYIAPANVNSAAIPFWADITTPTRTVLKGYNKEEAAQKVENRTKLNIYYTELD